MGTITKEEMEDFAYRYNLDPQYLTAEMFEPPTRTEREVEPYQFIPPTDDELYRMADAWGVHFHLVKAEDMDLSKMFGGGTTDGSVSE